MTKLLTYHYVRPTVGVRFTGLHVCPTSEFEEQLAYLGYAQFTPLRNVARAVAASDDPPADSYCCTFDDGLIDHYLVAYPRLRSHGIGGAFFPPVPSTLYGVLLDVHEIQLIIASGAQVSFLWTLVNTFLQAEGGGDLIGAFEPDLPTHSPGARWDVDEVRTFKHALQTGLPSPIRETTVQHVFAQVVAEDPRCVARELYLDLAQLREMVKGGMELCGHSDTHRRLNTLSDNDLRAEVDASLELLTAAYGETRSDWVFCYPLGSHDERVAEAVRSAGFAAGVGTHSGPVRASSDIMSLPRYDTNEFGKLEFAQMAQ